MNLIVEKEIAVEYDEWLDDHMGEMLRLPGFLSATVAVTEGLGGSPEDAVDGTRHACRCVRYELDGRHRLDEYLEKYAADMRTRVPSHFAGNVSAWRRLMLDETRCV